ncbi:MAG: hypothetical protein M1114_01575 [Candidatus Dependentiae bacterium]|nr:hypothetical protein [Candidatus Dependentiae bacterium]
MIHILLTALVMCTSSLVAKLEIEPRPSLKKMPFSRECGDSKWEWRSKYRNDIVTFGQGLSDLSHCPFDRTITPGKHTFDTTFMYHYGSASHGYDVMKLVGTLRNRYIFGDPEANAATAPTTIKDLEVVMGEHSHPLTLLLPIVRELWLETTLNDLIGFCSLHRHTFTVGVFPFQLGRGIALGDAYATVPDFLGYNPANAVQQYAPGFKFSGALMDDEELCYDLYVEIADNKSDTFNNVNLRLRGQQYGHRFNSARGFGILDYIIAGRLMWYPWDEVGKRLYVEPYGLFDNEREQRIEFVGDASSKLGTLGLALEAEYGDFEIGFDTAFNFGKQCVYGWDRNVVTKENRRGIPTIVNDKVIAIADNAATNDLAGKKAVYIPGSSNQDLIEQGVQSQALNGQQIGDSNLRNATDRFSDPYTNKYKGKMFVLDAAYWFDRPCLKWAWAVGMATGDLPPNKDLDEINDSSIDGDYKGFISLQEVYAGTRVRSAFLLGGASRVPRINAFPNPAFPGDRTAAVVTRFTNIAFGGSALWMDYTICGRSFKINPNILVYGQEHATRVFDRVAQQSFTSRSASRFLGTEINSFLEAILLPDLKLFAVTAIFIPGTHFDDVKGRPITREQQKALDEFDRTGALREDVPFLDNRTAYYLNLGFEYRF